MTYWVHWWDFCVHLKVIFNLLVIEGNQELLRKISNKGSPRIIHGLSMAKKGNSFTQDLKVVRQNGPLVLIWTQCSAKRWSIAANLASLRIWNSVFNHNWWIWGNSIIVKLVNYNWLLNCFLMFFGLSNRRSHVLRNTRNNFEEFCIPIAMIPAIISNSLPGTEFSLGPCYCSQYWFLLVD